MDILFIHISYPFPLHYLHGSERLDINNDAIENHMENIQNSKEEEGGKTLLSFEPFPWARA
jgi:hypothetical protein